MTWFNSIIATLTGWGLQVSKDATGEQVAEIMANFKMPDINAALAPLQEQIKTLQEAQKNVTAPVDQTALLQSIRDMITESQATANTAIEEKFKVLSTAVAEAKIGVLGTPPADPNPNIQTETKAGVVKMTAKDLTTANAGQVAGLSWLN